MKNHPRLKSRLLGHLSRVTSPGRKFVPQIDGLRFIAIMSVVAYHVAIFFMSHRGFASETTPVTFWLNTIFSAGHSGVPLFFAISGFILSLPFARQGLGAGPKVSIREYYVRRVTRIEPPYVIQLAVMFLLCVLVLRHLPGQRQLYQNPDWLPYSVTHILASLVYLNNLIFGVHPYPNMVLWSLEIEVQFYLLAPLLARVFFVRNTALRRGLLGGLFLAGLAANLCFGGHYRIWTSLAGNLHFFIIGFFFADLHVQERLARAQGEFKWDLALPLAGGLVVWSDHAGLLGGVLLPVAVALGFAAAFQGLAAVRFLSNAWTVTIGGMCYTIYMYHLVLISMLSKVTEKLKVSNHSLDLLLQFVLLSAGIIPVCAILFALFERPFMDRRWPAKLRQKAGELVWRKVTPARGPAEKSELA